MVLDFLFGKKIKKAEFGLLRPQDKDYVASEWGRLGQLLDGGRPSAYKEAVITADKLLDYALKQTVTGETMGERLKNARDGFLPDVYQALWDAHKMRNSLVHDARFELTVAVAKDVLEKYRRGFAALGVRV